jgi:hypothetical protein
VTLGADRTGAFEDGGGGRVGVGTAERRPAKSSAWPTVI